MAEFKFWREENRTNLKDVIPLATPYSVYVETSSLCNLQCIYCAHSSKEHEFYKGNMSFELFEKILSEVSQFPDKVKYFDMFCFGEPLCNPKLAEMIRKAKKSGVVEKIGFTTNGLLFNETNIHKIIESGVDVIRISLQGLDSETYKRICGAQIDYEKFVNNLRYLYEHRGHCKIRMKIADISVDNTLNPKKRLEEIFGGISDSLFIEHILPLYKDVNYDDISFKIRMNSLNGREDIQQKKIRKVCHRIFYRVAIRANGDVTATCCDQANDIKYGNIYDNSLVSLWNGAIHKSLMRMQLEGNRFQHPACRDCVAPNDITNVADILDPYAKEILDRFR